jgi:NNP family nitrate/nitrite transporter-like MFS transporter
MIGSGVWTSCFMLMFALVAIAFLWMHASHSLMERKNIPRLPSLPFSRRWKKPVLESLETRRTGIWLTEGQKIARRNLWLSVPAFSWLLLYGWCGALWSSICPDRLCLYDRAIFWLTALPGLSGATLRIFYAFMVPIFGGRALDGTQYRFASHSGLWHRHGGAGSNTPYSVSDSGAVVRFGGGNFASSMANIAFFFPKKEKGNALALNAGLGNLGVSAVQFLVPMVITVGLFGGLGGSAQRRRGTSCGFKMPPISGFRLLPLPQSCHGFT